MKSLIFALTLAALPSVTACEKEKVPEPPSSAPASTVAVAPPVPGVPATSVPAVSATAKAAPPAENIPVAADFEEEAEKSITKANYRAELDSLEAELK